LLRSDRCDRRGRWPCPGRTGPAGPDPDGLRDADHGRLGGDAAHQGPTRAARHPDHRDHLARDGRGRGQGPPGRVRRLHGEADPRGRSPGKDPTLHRIGRPMPEKILVVDDEPFNLDLLEQELADRGYLVERARDGAEALRKCEAAPPDVVLLDYMMPGMN